MDINGMSSLYTDYAKTSASNSEFTKIQNKLSSDLSGSSDEELMDVCKQFESYFMEKIFSAMMDTIPKVDDEETYASKMVDYFKDSAVQTLAEQSTEQGGFGLAKTLYEQMKRQYDSSTINV